MPYELAIVEGVSTPPSVPMAGAIDLHSHILPGLDDGPDRLEQSLDLAREMVADGVRLVAATPHVRGDYPNTPDRIEEAVAVLRAALEHAAIPLQVVAGAELAVDRLEGLGVDELRRLSIAGNGVYLLLETPYRAWPVQLHEGLFALRRAGFRPILAHPERNPEVQRRPDLLEPLVAGGVLVQLTAASVDGRSGMVAREASVELLRKGLAHIVASDAHGPELRAAGLSSARAALGGFELADWLTVDVPEAVVTGMPAPPRPVAAVASRNPHMSD